MSRESTLWKWFARARVILGPERIQMTRVENMIGAGFPDVEGYARLDDACGAFWIELKSSARPVRPLTPVRFSLRNRDAQIEWLRRRWALGANAYFLLQVGGAQRRTLYLLPGKFGPVLREGMTEDALASAAVGVFKHPVCHVDLIRRALTCRT